MVQGAPEPLPDSIVVGQFSGIKNTVAAERLTATELERALNVDIDDSGQVRRRRGRTLVSAGDFHSIYDFQGTLYGVRNSALGIIGSNYDFAAITPVSASYISYTSVGGTLYFSSSTHAGKLIGPALVQWGSVIDGTWTSPVVLPTATLGEVSGKRLSKPPLATEIEEYSGRIYLAHEKTLWATELWQYDLVDKARNFMQFEDNITLLKAVNDGLYVGTTAALYFVKGVLGSMRLEQVAASPVIRGSGARVPAEMVHPNARTGPMPTSEALVLMTDAGIMACFDGGTTFNLTQGQVSLPKAIDAAALFRQQDGANSYVVVADSAGTPAANARIGDYVDAEIVRFQGG